MASSTDFQKIHDLYQSQGVPKGISIVQFCQMNGIVYSQFERWYKQSRRADVVPVEIVNSDSLPVFVRFAIFFPRISSRVFSPEFGYPPVQWS